MTPDERDALVALIHQTEGGVVLGITGGGISVITDLLLVPGASRTVLEIVIPYAEKALRELLGNDRDGAVSVETARNMASYCYRRATELRPHLPVFGIACTAALVSDRVRRGADRACLGVTTPKGIDAWEIAVKKSQNQTVAQNRITQDRDVSDHLLQVIASTMGIESAQYLKDEGGVISLCPSILAAKPPPQSR